MIFAWLEDKDALNFLPYLATLDNLESITFGYVGRPGHDKLSAVLIPTPSFQVGEREATTALRSALRRV